MLWSKSILINNTHMYCMYTERFISFCNCFSCPHWLWRGPFLMWFQCKWWGTKLTLKASAGWVYQTRGVFVKMTVFLFVLLSFSKKTLSTESRKGNFVIKRLYLWKISTLPHISFSWTLNGFCGEQRLWILSPDHTGIMLGCDRSPVHCSQEEWSQPPITL